MFICEPGISYLHWPGLCVYILCKAKSLSWAGEPEGLWNEGHVADTEQVALTTRINPFRQCLAGRPSLPPGLLSSLLFVQRRKWYIYHIHTQEKKTGFRWWVNVLKIRYIFFWKGNRKPKKVASSSNEFCFSLSTTF